MQYVPVLTVDRSSDRLHLRVEERAADGTHRRTLVDERCQTDESGSFDTIREGAADAIREAGPALICNFCADALAAL